MILRWSIALIVCGILVWAISLDFSEPQSNVVVESQVIDYFIEELEFTSLDTDGAIDYTLTTPMMLHYRNADNIHFSNPVIEVIDNTMVKWKLVSDKGIASTGGSDIHLEENVIVTDMANKYTPTALMTSRAQINRESQTISSEEPVDVIMGVNTLSSIGLQISIDSGIVELNSNIQGLYKVQNIDEQSN